jgi:hypothetical protein
MWFPRETSAPSAFDAQCLAQEAKVLAAIVNRIFER